MLSLLSTSEEGSEEDEDDDDVSWQGRLGFLLFSALHVKTSSLGEEDKVSLPSMIVQKGVISDLHSIVAVLMDFELVGFLSKLVAENANKEQERKRETHEVSSRKAYNHYLVAEKEDFFHAFPTLLIAVYAGGVGVGPETEKSLKDVILTELGQAVVHGLFVHGRSVSLMEEDGEVHHGNPAIQSVVEVSLAHKLVFSQTRTDSDVRSQLLCNLIEGLRGISLVSASSYLHLHVMISKAVESCGKEKFLSSFLKKEVRMEKDDDHKSDFFHHEDDKFGDHGCGNMAGFFNGRDAPIGREFRQGLLDNQLAVINHIVVSKAANGSTECQGKMVTCSGLSPCYDKSFHNARKRLFCLFSGIIQYMYYPTDCFAMLFSRQEKAVFLGSPPADFKEKGSYSLLNVELHGDPMVLAEFIQKALSKSTPRKSEMTLPQMDVFKRLPDVMSQKSTWNIKTQAKGMQHATFISTECALLGAAESFLFWRNKFEVRRKEHGVIDTLWSESTLNVECKGAHGKGLSLESLPNVHGPSMHKAQLTSPKMRDAVFIFLKVQQISKISSFCGQHPKGQGRVSFVPCNDKLHLFGTKGAGSFSKILSPRPCLLEVAPSLSHVIIMKEMGGITRTIAFALNVRRTTRQRSSQENEKVHPLGSGLVHGMHYLDQSQRKWTVYGLGSHPDGPRTDVPFGTY